MTRTDRSHSRLQWKETREAASAPKQTHVPWQESSHSPDRGPPRETRPSEAMLNDEPNEPREGRRGYELSASAEKGTLAQQHPTREPNRRTPGGPNLPDSRAAIGDGTAARAFANVAARSCHDRGVLIPE
jgi:hypothetical protein